MHASAAAKPTAKRPTLAIEARVAITSLPRSIRVEGSCLDSEQVDRVAAGQPLALLVGQSLEVALDDIARVRERHVEMRVVVRPHAVLLAPPRERAGADI